MVFPGAVYICVFYFRHSGASVGGDDTFDWSSFLWYSLEAF